MRGVLNFLKRPFVGEQTTGRDAFAGYQGLALGSINGISGFTVKGQIGATYPAGIVPGPSHKLNDPSATGNDSYSTFSQPLTRDNRSI